MHTTHQKNPWRRIAAYGLDWILLALYGGLVFGSVVATVGMENLTVTGPYDPWRMQGIAFVVMTLPFGLYLGCAEASRHQATLGKRWQRLRVVDAQNKRPTRAQIVRRTVTKLLPWEIGHFFAHQLIAHSRATPALDPPGWLWIPFTVSTIAALIYVLALFRPGFTPYDVVGGTQVIRAQR